MQCKVMREQPLGVLQPISSRGLHENMTRSWRGMEDAHLKILKHLLLDGCMRLSYHILRLGYLHSGYIYNYIYIYIYIYTICHGQEQGSKGRGKEVQSDTCRVTGPLCIWQVGY